MSESFEIALNLYEEIMNALSKNEGTVKNGSLIGDVFLRTNSKVKQLIGFCEISRTFEKFDTFDSRQTAKNEATFKAKRSAQLVQFESGSSVAAKKLKSGGSNSRVTTNGSNGRVAQCRNGSVASESTGSKVDVSSLVNTVIANNGEKSLQCSFCGYQSTYLSAVKRHLEMKHMPSKVVFPCQTCQKTFKLKQDLKKHYMNIHKMPEPAAKTMISC